MRKKKKRIFIFLFLLLITSFVLLMNDTILHEKEKRMYNISVITRGKNSESSMIIRQGIEQAASEMDVNIRFITLAEDNSTIEQKELIEKEIRNKADAIVIAPTDYEKMSEPIENAMRKIPVVMIESTIKSEQKLSSISCNNYALGENLAEEVVKNGNVNNNIVIVKNNLECSSIKERYDGFMSVLSNTKNNYIFWEFNDSNPSTYREETKKILEDSNINVIVAFDSEELEWIAQTKKDFGNIDKKIADVQVYGVGSTNKIISFLEDKIINATAIQNEFNVGYLGIKTAVDKLNKKKENENSISSTVINKDNMYSETNQRLLFPFIK
ncbi:ribose transport system substrate-binding protein [Clostridium saccharoperbutylacetonicum]|uniref:Monosaccharide ABC transporter substrate-binding protein, CUT2 family n=2 Tax=Clostridium saccharoperbutylacetonicum TaxID=36745 RepID=M1MUQ8_9CLOT|nr:substrate-binding domain-containing protein [Clostridium saccharoperbutylacetonicum]AGF58416.1 monosaccharide ABC transporter substrate-binding protein, CUT2 family [Clostridium saccharoperbutylacetonicum N1-4(HMT)]NRT60806.1 ribose transport system substrate-binding protein [Clostridium saccharoperbutylacetonicum]NSB24120.1 ribose transport system substrate-binding protein [Clostridium saccharoperbutylacetonicum]NSB43498.1 ribose transport system substrate-binding protein [Clostridium sacch